MSKYKFDMSVNISAETIKAMIAAAVEAEFNRPVTAVELNLNTVSVGYGRDERDITQFSGATVRFASNDMEESRLTR